ncbi:DUF4175 family protein [Psychroserpens sp.]|uniref:DUF4175 family protein n=1 Tax=Psychroserpens sp. TaxID=2020870 RepID=UPI001AFF5839|nr:DUF4175 family protein [Psychroserpens sp.]MBO6605361.1 hypothetical protein [Psychroserpens sp.]MBO6629956.1 hypothetical protein [Psychroserpens sp.]MBO6653830.1 hypothetical protein [Psychroserpens sp.]MBO6682151.1 hypothetical protein [Psychroserpens sp.]MBO6748735.1 hypothetical protein [Psychroserpens sp.]
MAQNFSHIQGKLEQFIKRYYVNELLKGAILFFAAGLLYFIVTLFIEYMLWLNPTARTILFWTFVSVEVALFAKFIAFPLARLFKLQKGIDYKTASKIIGDHFPEVNDKLLNVLQLKESNLHSELLEASIEQKSAELSPIPFKLAINFNKNTKYLKYAAIPIVILLVSFATGKINWFSDSYERVVNYSTAYEPPAPFQFFVVNEELKAIENKDYKVIVTAAGELVPENAQIHFNGQSFFMQQTQPGQFEFVFVQPKQPVSFNLSANDVVSKDYTLDIVKVPSLLNFEMLLDYPSYTKKTDEVLKSTGSATIPEGTKVTWNVNTRSTESVALYAQDTLAFDAFESGRFEASKRIFANTDYSISTSNAQLKDYENLAFSINVIKDSYPELNVKMERDSLDNQTLYFYGQVSDDYGLSKLQMVYYPSDTPDDKKKEVIDITKSNFDEFVSVFPNQLNLEEGVNYELYFQVFDNDALHNFKSAKSPVFSYRKLTKDEVEKKQLEEQNETIKDISKTFDKLKEQDKELERLSKTQKEKKELNFNDKKKFENFLKRQKEQEQLMQNFNKKLKENIEEFQNEDNEKDQFKEDLQKRLEENEEQLKKDEKLLEELEKMQDKINKEEFTQKLEQLAKQNKNKEKSLQQLLELTKRFYVAKKAEKLMKELEEMAEEQEKLSEESKENNTKEAQEKLNEKFEEFQKQMEELDEENKKLKKPMDLPQDKPTEESIKQDQKEATDALEEQQKQDQQQQAGEEQEGQEEQEEQEQNEKQNSAPQDNQQKAKKKQKQAAQKMKEMSQQMAQSMSMNGGEQMQEDIDVLRQILDNLVLFSFDQENLMDQFKSIEINHNEYGKFLRKQSNLREHFEHIDDSLFALSLRQPMLSERVNSQITNVFFNIDKALNQLSENQIYQGVASQQYTVTSTNELASFLSDVLDNMNMQMNPSMDKGQGQSQQLPDIIMSQEELNKKMEEGMKKGQKGKKPQEGEKGQEGEGENEQDGENGNPKDGKDGKKSMEQLNGEQQGNGEGNSEVINGELYEIYQRQQQLRQALENRLGKEGKKGLGGDLLKKMEEIELDLINKGFTNQTLQKMMDLQHQLLKLENATFMQGQDNKRKSETNNKTYDVSIPDQTPKAKEYFNTTEILNRQALPLQQIYKKKVQAYFKKTNDQL